MPTPRTFRPMPELGPLGNKYAEALVNHGYSFSWTLPWHPRQPQLYHMVIEGGVLPEPVPFVSPSPTRGIRDMALFLGCVTIEEAARDWTAEEVRRLIEAAVYAKELATGLGFPEFPPADWRERL